MQQQTNPIRQAVAAGEFDRAMVLWDEYVSGIKEEIGGGICTAARMAEAAELVEWSRRVVLCDRAHAQGELNTVWVAAQYGPADASPTSLLRASL